MKVQEVVAIDVSGAPSELEGVTECSVYRHLVREGDESLPLSRLSLCYQLPAQSEGGYVSGREVLRWCEQTDPLLFANALVAEKILHAAPYRFLNDRRMFPSKDPSIRPTESTVCFLGTLWRAQINKQLCVSCVRGIAGENPPWRLSHRWVLAEKFGPHDYFALVIPKEIIVPVV